MSPVESEIQAALTRRRGAVTRFQLLDDTVAAEEEIADAGPAHARRVGKRAAIVLVQPDTWNLLGLRDASMPGVVATASRGTDASVAARERARRETASGGHRRGGERRDHHPEQPL